MRKKRTRLRHPAPDRDKPSDATGLTIDWIGIQATGGGAAGCLPFWFVGGLMALRAAPFLLWNVVPGGLVPVEIDRERDVGLYVEPNYWMVHRAR